MTSYSHYLIKVQPAVCVHSENNLFSLIKDPDDVNVTPAGVGAEARVTVRPGAPAATAVRALGALAAQT